MTGLSNKKILAVELGGFGDALLATPALRAVAKDNDLHILASPGNVEFFRSLPYVKSTSIFFLKYGGKMSFSKLIPNIFTLLRLRSQRFDLAINLRTLVSENSARNIRWLFRIIRAKKTAGKDTCFRGSFYDIKIPETDIGEKHEMDYDLDLVKALGILPTDQKIDFPVGQLVNKKVSQLLISRGVKNSDIIIGIHPGGMLSRRWPLENFAELIDSLADKPDHWFVITGSGADSLLAKTLKDSVRAKVLDLTGKLNIFETAALIKLCRLFISNDTGPMHLAAISGVPLVALFGPGDLTRFDPRKISSQAVVIQGKAGCSPCNKFSCVDMRCLKDISVEIVGQKAGELLDV